MVPPLRVILFHLLVEWSLGAVFPSDDVPGIPGIGAEQCGDVAFVIDSSRSISESNFKTQIKFVQEIIKMFNIGPDRTHVAAITFGHVVRKEFYFNEYDTKEEVLKRVGKIQHIFGDQTLTHDALEYTRTTVFSTANGARQNVPKLCILLSDGKSTYPEKTEQQANLARNVGIRILAIGIGDQVNDSEMKTIASPPWVQNYLKASTFGDLEKVAFQKLVGQTACGGCSGKEADVILIMDMSGSIYPEPFKQQLQFLSDLVSNFNIDGGKKRVGMMAFSDKAEVQFHLNDYTSSKKVTEAILNVKQKGGGTNTHLALQKLIEEMFTPQHGSRPGVAHICILITDGESSKPESTISMALKVHQKGVYVFAIGVGDKVNKVELERIASKPSFVFEVQGYQALATIKNFLAYETCKVEPEPQPRIMRRPDVNNGRWTDSASIDIDDWDFF